jgi:endonuclease I
MKKIVLAFLIVISFGKIVSAQCVTPGIAANLTLNAVDTAIGVYYDSTASSNAYLGIISTNPSLTENPVNGINYSIGNSIGGGKVIYNGSNYVFKVGGLTAGTTYYIYIYSEATGCTGQPVYSSFSLSGSVATFNGTSDIPSGYYDAANGLACATLKTALFNIIKPTLLNPDPTYREILETITMTDDKISEDGKLIVWDIYSDNPSGPEPYEYTFGSPYQDKGTGGNVEGQFYNREHTFPQAWFGGKVEPMYSDAFIVYPTDKKVNGIRANSPYGIVGTPTFTSLNGTKVGNNISSAAYTGTVFEPIDAYKGDVARSNLYVATAYEDQVVGWQKNANADDILDGTTYPAFDTWYINLLYQWHIQDPVSQKEIDRNNEVYMLQGTRNPYIDHPEYVALVWQCSGVVPVTLINFNATKYNESAVLTWYATREINFKGFEIERSIDGINFEKINFVAGQNLANYSFTDKQLPDAATVFYRIKMVDEDSKSSYSKIVTVKLNNNFSDVLVYPNPASSSLNIKLQQPLSQNSTLKITEVTGRNVLQQIVPAAQNNIKVDVHNLSAGSYFITIKNDAQLVHHSFVIIK